MCVGFLNTSILRSLPCHVISVSRILLNSVQNSTEFAREISNMKIDDDETMVIYTF